MLYNFVSAFFDSIVQDWFCLVDRYQSCSDVSVLWLLLSQLGYVSLVSVTDSAVVGFIGLTDTEMVKSFKKETYQLQQTETVIFC